MANSPPTAKQLSDLTDVIKSVLPQEYWGPLEASVSRGSGWEIYTALAAMWARVSQAVVRADTDYRIDTAPAGSYATVPLTITRSSAPAKVLTIGPGSIVMTPRGEAFVVAQGSQADWTSGENSAKAVEAQSLLQTYQANVRVGSLTVLTQVLPAGQDSAHGTLTVTNATAAEGGTPDMLSLLAASRGVYRQEGEDAEAFRARAKSLPDNITPNAMRRALDAALKPLGFADADDGGDDYEYRDGVDMGLAADDVLACDDTTIEFHERPPARGVRAFYCRVPNVTAVLNGHSGGFCDDELACDDGNGDGSAFEAEAFYRALYETLRAKRLAGVAHYLMTEA